jgi:maltoporin
MTEGNFVDYVKIYVSSGKGGKGSTHLHREKFIEKGGPDGGDGGRGGHVIIRGSKNLWTLFHLKFLRHVKSGHGGDGGSTRTYVTYGAPNLETNSFSNDYSMTFTETFLWNMNKKYSLNGYAEYTKSRGASDSLNKAPDYLGKQMLYNRKQDIAFGARGTWYIKKWLHLLHELDFAWRKDGTQPFAQMTKLSVAPTLVPTGVTDVWARPQIRFIYCIAHYNQFAADNLYSSYLMQSGVKSWGQYLGVKAEWWIW